MLNINATKKTSWLFCLFEMGTHPKKVRYHFASYKVNTEVLKSNHHKIFNISVPNIHIFFFFWRIEFLCTSVWWYRHTACTVFLVLKNRTVIHHTVPGHDADIWSYARYCFGNIWSLLYRVSGITMHWKIRSLWL